MVLRDLDLYKDILFGHYLKGNDNDTFTQQIRNLHDEASLYRNAQMDSQWISEYYSKKNVLNMWKEFYMDAYNEKFKK